jgi:predicted nucleic acid-binding protein
VIIADTSGLLALFNRREPAHERVAAAVAKSTGPLVVSPFVIAEVDYLLATRSGVDAELAVLRELASGAYEHAALGSAELEACAEVVARYRDQGIGITDASLVVLARRYETRTILTLDRRHFGVIRPLGGGHFKLIGP